MMGPRTCISTYVSSKPFESDARERRPHGESRLAKPAEPSRHQPGEPDRDGDQRTEDPPEVDSRVATDLLQVVLDLSHVSANFADVRFEPGNARFHVTSTITAGMLDSSDHPNSADCRRESSSEAKRQRKSLAFRATLSPHRAVRFGLPTRPVSATTRRSNEGMQT